LAFALYWQGRVALELRDYDAARRGLEECRDLGQELTSGPAVAHPLTMLGLLEVQRGDLARAGAQLSQSLRLHLENGDYLGCIWSLEGLAQLADRNGEPERATRLLAASGAERERLGTGWSRRERADADALKARLHGALGDASFGSAWATGSSMSLPEVVRLDLEHSVVPVADGDGQPREVRPTPNLAALRPSLVVRALGELRVELDGRELPRTAWSSARAKELLLLLLCHPAGRTREQVGVALWPEASSEQLRNSFHVTLHRLRKILGGPAWVALEDDRNVIESSTVDFDALRFEQEVPPALKRLASAGDVAGVEARLASYDGDFLEHETAGEWHLELRERLRSMYLDALWKVGEWWFRQDSWSEAGAAFCRLIMRDGLHEAAYRRLMICHAKLGERAEALLLWRCLEALLERELGAIPEPETKALYLRLKRSEPV